MVHPKCVLWKKILWCVVKCSRVHFLPYWSILGVGYIFMFPISPVFVVLFDREKKMFGHLSLDLNALWISLEVLFS